MVEYTAFGSQVKIVESRFWLAAALGDAGRFKEALEAIDQSVTFLENFDERLFEAKIYRLKGELLRTIDSSNST